MLKFERFLIRERTQHQSPVNSIELLLIILICIRLSPVNSASLILKPPTKCGDPGVPAFGKLLTNNPVLPSTAATLQARSSPPNLITGQNDFIVSNNSEISIDILNFNNNALDPNQATYEQGEIVSYTCFVGHLMVGSAHRKCLPNGKWSGTLPVCDTLLDQFDLMKSVELSNSDTYSNSSNATLGQEPGSFSTLTAQSVNYLKFSPPELAIDHRFSTCFHSEKYGLRMLRVNLNKSMRILGVAITIPKENLDYDFSVYIANSKQNMGKGRLCLQFRGTFATKTTILLCQTTVLGDRINIEDNSKQIQTFSICEVQIYIEKDEIDCGEPEVPLNGLIVSRTRAGVEYQCKLGYFLTGSTVRQCQKSGLYGGEQAVCNEIQCKEESPRTGIEDQQLSLQISAQLNGIQLNCEPGFQFAGIRNHSIVCLGDGRFDTRISPLCESIDCGSPLYISEQVNGEFVPLLANRTTYGSMAKLRCFDAQSVYSSEQVLITCGSDGQWSAPKAICVSDPLRSSNQTRQLKNRLGTIIVSVLLILVLLILLLTIYLFKKRILLLAMNLNENKLAAETNLRRNVHLITTNGGVVTNPNLINSIGPELCLDVDSSSNSENNSSSQPSSKISIQRLFRRRTMHPTDTETKSLFSGLADKLFSLKRSVKTSKLSNYVSCLSTADDPLNNNMNEQYTISNQLLNSHLNGHLNPIFIDQLDCQDTSIKECAFRQYSSTLKHNQISLVRLQNAQRAARLIKASNCQFNNPFNNQFGQFDPINHFVRQQLITSSMKSDSLLISTRRQIVRDQLIKTIRPAPNQTAERQQHEISLSNETPSSQLIQSKQQLGRAPDAAYSQESNGHRSKEEDGKQFYYFAQHCFTLPQNHHLSQPANSGRHQIGRLVQPDAYRGTALRETFGKSPDICLNASDTASSGSESGSSKSSSNGSSNGSSNKSSSENSTNAKTKSNCGLPANLKSSSTIIGPAPAIHESDLERKANRTLTTTTADIHLNKNLKKLHPGSSQSAVSGQVDASIAGFEISGFADRFAEKAFEANGQPPSANKLGRLKANGKVLASTEAEAKSEAGSNADVNNVNNSTVSLKYIVIDDAVFAD